MNRIEEMWYNNRPTGDAWIPCDQVIMSVVFDKNIIQQSHTYEVRLGLTLIHGYTIIFNPKRSAKLNKIHDNIFSGNS